MKQEIDIDCLIQAIVAHCSPDQVNKIFREYTIRKTLGENRNGTEHRAKLYM